MKRTRDEFLEECEEAITEAAKAVAGLKLVHFMVQMGIVDMEAGVVCDACELLDQRRQMLDEHDAKGATKQ